MSLLGNVIWLICGGLATGLAYIVAGLVLCLTIIGIPFGMQAIKLGFANLAPFGKNVVDLPGSGGLLQLVFNLVWLVLVGWWLALGHLLAALLLALTIIGIPFAVQHLKLVPLALFPFGHELR
ncbi:MAG TPA: YccF domain-containing protein [Kofleriaceae bacterium]|nr:YccF domain-containing protein [Kofleriaceae bacterium]